MPLALKQTDDLPSCRCTLFLRMRTASMEMKVEETDGNENENGRNERW